MEELTVYAIPAFFATMCLEGWLLAKRTDVRGYEWRDTAASLSMGVGNLIVNLTLRALTLPFFFLLYEMRIFDLGSGVIVWVALFFAEDLAQPHDLFTGMLQGYPLVEAANHGESSASRLPAQPPERHPALDVLPGKAQGAFVRVSV